MRDNIQKIEVDYKKLIQCLECLKYYKDRVDHHPERNVLEHSLQSYYIAKRETDDKELIIASLFHDIGKQIFTLEHHKFSVDILQSFGFNNEKVMWLIENHIRIISWLNGQMKRYKKSKELFNNEWFLDLVHLRRIDYSARNKNKHTKFTEELKLEINNLLDEVNG